MMFATIAQPHNKTFTVKAYKTATPELFVHKSVNGTGWTVSHARTGYAMFDFCKTREIALIAAGWLATMDGLETLDPANVDTLKNFYNENKSRLIDIRDYVNGTAPRPM